jgi:predicted Zn-dependent protease
MSVRAAPADDLSSDEVRQLMEIGFHAAFAGRVPEALALFEALGRLRPQAGFPRIGTAQALLVAGRENEAVRVLEVAHGQDPADDDVRVMLGLALRLARRSAQTERVLEPLLRSDGDDGPGRLARRLMAMPAL